jgi:hypothetical protein
MQEDILASMLAKKRKAEAEKTAQIEEEMANALKDKTDTEMLNI